MDNAVSDIPNLPATVEFEQTRIRMPSRPDWIDPTVEYLKQKALLCGACQEARAGKLLLALHEALSNAVVHGNLELSSALKEQGDDAFAAALAKRSADSHYASRTVEILASYDGDCYTWSFTDQGQGFEVEQVLGRSKKEPDSETPLASGRGLLIMQAFLDEVRYELGGRRVVLAMHRKSGAEKRLYPRHPLQTPVRVVPVHPDGKGDWDSVLDGMARNFSQGGITAVQTRPSETKRVLIGFGSTGEQQVFLPAEVRHVRAIGEHLFEVGYRFDFDFTPLAPDQVTAKHLSEADAALGAVLDRLGQTPTTPTERRAHPRFAYTERVVLEGKRGQSSQFGYARDLSKGGIAFITTAPLPLEVRVIGLPREGQTPLRVRVLVLRCGKIMEGFYDVAARFLGLEAAADRAGR